MQPAPTVTPAVAAVAATPPSEGADTDTAPLQWLLCHPFLRFIADLSYWAYLIHPTVFTALFSHPWLLYPPAPDDRNPAAWIHGTAAIERTNASYAAPPTAVGDAVRWWSSVGRPALGLHEGEALSYPSFVAITAIATVATYAASYVLLHTVEEWGRRLLAACGSAARTAIWWYSVGIMVLGAAVHLLVTPAVWWWLQPTLEVVAQQWARTLAIEAGVPDSDMPPLPPSVQLDLVALRANVTARLAERA